MYKIKLVFIADIFVKNEIILKYNFKKISMKKIIVLMILSNLSISMFSQINVSSDSKHAQMFSLSPISKQVDKINGLVFGVGHIDNKNIQNQTINGVNVEANPAPIAGVFIGFLGVMYLPEIIKNKSWKRTDTINSCFKIKNWDYSPKLKINGLNISTGCFFVPTDMNGFNVSLGNKFKNFNGLSIAPLGTISDIQNGICIGVINANNNLNGATIGLFNQSFELKGIQIGVFNRVQSNKGIQFGIFNRSYKRGFQFGIWNKNNKHSYPLINW